jgi:hypothetical protein
MPSEQSVDRLNRVNMAYLLYFSDAFGLLDAALCAEPHIISVAMTCKNVYTIFFKTLMPLSDAVILTSNPKFVCRFQLPKYTVTHISPSRKHCDLQFASFSDGDQFKME